jgi:hypothetical protein
MTRSVVDASVVLLAFGAGACGSRTPLEVVAQDPATVKSPPSGSKTSRWMEGGTAVVGRWSEGAPRELRIGDATP